MEREEKDWEEEIKELLSTVMVELIYDSFHIIDR